MPTPTALLVVLAALAGAGRVFAACLAFDDKSGLPAPRSSFAVGVVSGKIYVAGGTENLGVDSNKECFEYDPAGDAWTTRNSMAVERSGGGGAGIGGSFFVAGGYLVFGGIMHDTVEEFDPVANIWTVRVATMSTVRSWPGAAAYGGKMYVFGGYDDGIAWTMTTSGEVLDPVADSWTLLAPMPQPRVGFPFVVSGSRIYAIGGGAPGGALSSSVYEYDPGADTWSVKAELRAPWSPTPYPIGLQAAAAAELNGEIYVVGGKTAAGALSTTIYVYSPASDAWRVELGMAKERFDFGMVSTNQRLYAVGGRDLSEPLATVQEGSVSTPGIVASLAIDPNPAGVGQWVSVTLSVTNTGKSELSSVEGAIQVNRGSDTVYLESVYPASAQALQDESSTRFIWTYSVSGEGMVDFTATVTAVDRCLVVHAAASSMVLEAVKRPIIAVTLSADPSPGIVGRRMTVRMDAANSVGYRADGVVPVLEIGETSVGLSGIVSGPSPTGPVSLAPGASTGFTWTLEVLGQGTLHLVGSVSGRDAVTNIPTGGSGTLAVLLAIPPPTVYPNPFHPSKAKAGVLKFVGLPAAGKISVFTVSGMLVWESPVRANGTAEWSGANHAGERVAAGVYLWVSETAGGQRRDRGRIVVGR